MKNSVSHSRTIPLKIVISLLLTSFFSGCILTALYFNPDTHSSSNTISSPLNSVETCFTPSKTCQSLIVKHIYQAQRSIRVQAYSFTDPVITDALIKAKNKGVSVELILDKSNIKDQRSQAFKAYNEEIPVYIDTVSGIAHNKVIIIDDNTLITGSYNFSKAAYTRNAENIIIISNPQIAEKYVENWKYRLSLSKRLLN